MEQLGSMGWPWARSSEEMPAASERAQEVEHNGPDVLSSSPWVPAPWQEYEAGVGPAGGRPRPHPGPPTYAMRGSP